MILPGAWCLAAGMGDGASAKRTSLKDNPFNTNPVRASRLINRQNMQAMRKAASFVTGQVGIERQTRLHACTWTHH